MTKLDEIEARANAATPGPWNHWPEAGEIELYRQGPEGRYDVQEIIATSIKPREGWGAIYGHDGKRIYRAGQPEPDAEFIAHSREDVPWLVDQLRKAEAFKRDVLALDAESGRQAYGLGYVAAVEEIRAIEASHFGGAR